MYKEDKDDTERVLSEEKQEDPEKKAKREIREEKLAIRDILNVIVSTKREILSLKMRGKTLNSNLGAMQEESKNKRNIKTNMEVEASIKEEYNKYLSKEVPYFA